jgi:hypothetical protein
MNNDAQVHPVDGGVAIGNVNFALEIFRRYREMGLLHGVRLQEFVRGALW